jgi:hypothetical protein
MFAGLRGFETSLRPSLRARRAADRLERRRAADARMIRRTLDDGGRPFAGRGPRYLIRPAVLRAAASDLRAVEAALADERRPVSADAVHAVDALLRDGTSPLYGSHPEAAADAARALRERVAPTAPAKVVTPAATQAPVAR